MSMRRFQCWMRVFATVLVVSLPSRLIAEQPARSSTVSMNFENMNLQLFIKKVAELSGKKIVIDDTVEGKFTIASPDASLRVDTDDLYRLMISILESRGYSVVEKQDAVHIIKQVEGRAIAGRMVVGDEPAGEGLVTKVIRIGHISAIELARLLEDLVKGGASSVVPFGATNHLIITANAETLAQLERLIRDLDQPGSTRTMEVIQLKHANPEELAAQLVAAMKAADQTSAENVSEHMRRVTGGQGTLPVDMVIVPVRAANSIVTIGTPVQLSQVRDIIAKVDIEAPVEFGRLNSIFLKYMIAEEAATTLNALLAKTTAKDQLARISIEHNSANNALIVEASPQDFELVRKLVNDLDRMPQQVMVEVVIAEVSMGEGLDLGVEWSNIDGLTEDSTRVVGRSRPGETDGLADIVTKGVFPQGLSVGVSRGSFVDAAGRTVPNIPLMVQALAKNRDVKILSNIPIWAQNNTEASISVVDNIPILSSQIEGAGANRDVIQNIERLDVGIKLKLTPHINADDEIKLKLNPSIEAIIDPGPAETPFAPTIAKREVVTTVTIPDQATVVISGLIREDQIKDVSKIPFLGDIPLLGFLFRSTKDKIQRTNLLIFVTPRIINDLAEAEAVKESLQTRSMINPTSAVPVAVEAEARP